ncbi:MAG TPA: hypothetical protein VHV47_14280 [Opitutaceae bacterium]|jgi:hypothetical protein|nr:hypothetical protein [Opitutaceae bacterium]
MRLPFPFTLSVRTAPRASAGGPPWLVAALYLLIAAGSILRVQSVWTHNPMDHIWSDPERYWDQAKEPLTPSPLAIFDPPVYQAWLSVVQRFTQGLPGLVALYAAALSLAAPWCWYRFLREAAASRTLALAGWAALSLLPTWIGIYCYFMSETLFLPLLGASLWMTVRADRKRTVPSFLTMVAFWLVTGLTRGIAIPLAAAAALLVWVRHPQRLKSALTSGLLALAILAPLSYRNYHFYSLWAPYGNGWLNRIYAESGSRDIQLHFQRGGATWLYGFGSPSIDTHPLAPFSAWTSHRIGTAQVAVDFDAGLRDWKYALRASAQQGRARWRLHGENLIFLFFGDSWPDNNPGYFIGRLANASRWLWAPVLLGLLAASAVLWRDTLARPLLPAVIALWLLFQAWILLVPNEGRYRKPAEGLFVAQIVVLADQVAARRRRPNPEAAPAAAV